MTATEPASGTISRRRHGPAVVATIVMVVVCVVLDLLARWVVPASGLMQRIVDIQTPATLYAKLDEVRRFQGTKVVVLGDSLVFGRTMRDHGDRAWEEHTLSAQLQRYLEGRHPDRRFLVSNLGMNGTLPTDLDHLLRIVAPLKPDLVIFDVGLRSFSRDFEADGDRQTRTWLADMTIRPDGRYTTTRSGTALDGLIQDFVVNNWYLYRLRDFTRALLFDSRPGAFALELRKGVDNWLKTGQFAAGSSDNNDLDSIVLLMRARSRYANIDLEADNPQRQALDRILVRLKALAQPAMIFYANENPEMLPGLLPRAKLEDLQRRLDEAVAPALSPKLAFVGPMSVFTPADFLDHVHLTRAGYQRLAAALGHRAEDLIAPGRP